MDGKKKIFIIVGAIIFIGIGIVINSLYSGNINVEGKDKDKKVEVEAVNYYPHVKLTVNVEDETWFGTAELYLTVQKATDTSVQVILPINVGKYIGRKEVAAVLPFYVGDEEELIFNVLEEDELDDEEVALLVGACDLTGYAVWVGGTIFAANHGVPLPSQAKDLVVEGSKLIGKAVIKNLEEKPFQNYGSGSYIVSKNRPVLPKDANKIHLPDKNNLARVTVQIYFPNDSIFVKW